MKARRNPFFITLDALRAQAAPQIDLARPWLRMPASVYCGGETTFTIELDAPMTLSRSYLQVILPPNAPVKSSLSSRALRAEAGQTLSFEVTLTCIGEQAFEPTVLTVRLRLEGSSLTIPVTIHPLAELRPIRPPQKITDTRFTLAHLPIRDRFGEEMAAAPALHAAYQDRKLHVALALPRDAPPGATFQLGLALEGADQHAEVRIESPLGRPKLLPARGTTRQQIKGWRCRLVEGEKPSDRLCDVTIPPRALGIAKFEPGMRLLLAVRYEEPRAGGWTAPLVLEWGQGLGQGRSTAGYRWVRLGESSGN